MLTVTDLKKIEDLVDHKLEDKFEEKLAPLKESIGKLQDMVLELHHFMITEFRFLQKHVDKNTYRIEKCEDRVGNLEKRI